MKNRTTTSTVAELEEWLKKQPVQQSMSEDFDSTQFGYWVKSKKQQLRESRINKLRQLEGKPPNIELIEDEWEGLVSVQPMSYPLNKLPYMDYKYGE